MPQQFGVRCFGPVWHYPQHGSKIDNGEGLAQSADSKAGLADDGATSKVSRQGGRQVRQGRQAGRGRSRQCGTAGKWEHVRNTWHWHGHDARQIIPKRKHMLECLGSRGLPRGFSVASVWFSRCSRRLPLSNGSTHTSV